MGSERWGICLAWHHMFSWALLPKFWLLSFLEKGGNYPLKNSVYTCVHMHIFNRTFTYWIKTVWWLILEWSWEPGVGYGSLPRGAKETWDSSWQFSARWTISSLFGVFRPCSAGDIWAHSCSVLSGLQHPLVVPGLQPVMREPELGQLL